MHTTVEQADFVGARVSDRPVDLSVEPITLAFDLRNLLKRRLVVAVGGILVENLGE